MRILIHGANLQKGGALQVAASLLEEFAQYPEHEYHILAAPPLVEAAADQLATGRFEVTSVQQSPTAGMRAWRRFLQLARSAELSWKPDVAFTVFGPGLWRPDVPHLAGFANGLYLFSDSRFIHEDWPVGHMARTRYALRRRLLLQRVRTEADAWWVETATAQQSLSKAANISGERIAVIPNAIGSAFLPFLESRLSSSAQDNARQPFRVLVMGADYPNKNLSLIAGMLPFYNDASVQFTFTLPQEDFERLFPDSIGDTRLKNLGPITPGDAPTAYCAADAVLLPSKLETFSAVLLEAAAAQKPLLAPGLPFAREVCEDTAQFFDPWNAASAVTALREVIENAQLRQRLVDAGYKRIKRAPTAAFRAQQILQVLQMLAATRS